MEILAEMRANRTHPRRSARLTTALKAAGPTRTHPSPRRKLPKARQSYRMPARNPDPLSKGRKIPPMTPRRAQLRGHLSYTRYASVNNAERHEHQQGPYERLRKKPKRTTRTSAGERKTGKALAAGSGERLFDLLHVDGFSKMPVHACIVGSLGILGKGVRPSWRKSAPTPHRPLRTCGWRTRPRIRPSRAS